MANYKKLLLVSFVIFAIFLAGCGQSSETGGKNSSSGIPGKAYSTSGLTLKSLGENVDIANYAARTDEEIEIFKTCAAWLNEFRTVDYKELESVTTMPGSKFTTNRFQNELDNGFSKYKSEVIKKQDTKQVVSLYLVDFFFQKIPELNNQTGAYLEFLMDFKLSQGPGQGYATTQCQERVVLIQDDGKWKVDTELFKQLKVYK